MLLLEALFAGNCSICTRSVAHGKSLSVANEDKETLLHKQWPAQAPGLACARGGSGEKETKEQKLA